MGTTPLPYTLPNQFDPLYNWEDDRDNGLDILADRHRANDVDAAAAISLALKRDGTSTVTQNIPMSGKRFTGGGAAVDPNDFIIKQQFDDELSPSVSNIGDYLTTERAPGSNWLKRDGATYTQATYPALAALLGAKYGKLAGFNLISSGSTDEVTNLAYGAGLFVWVSGGGKIRTSPTGAVWTSRTSGTTNDFARVAFVNSNVFVATTFSGDIRTSPDGITWTSRTSGVATALRSIASNGSKIVICGASAVILVSTDGGANWAPRTVSGYSENLAGAAYGNGRYVLTGGTTGAAVVSTDGDTWSWSRTGYQGGHQDVTFGKGRFVADGADSAYTSTSGSGSWMAVPLPATMARVKFGLNNFIACGTGATASSIDGLAWDTHTAISGTFYAIGIGPTFALIGGATGVLAQSAYAYDTVTQFQVPGDNPDNGFIKAL